jgi:hypothetical protein
MNLGKRDHGRLPTGVALLVRPILKQCLGKPGEFGSSVELMVVSEGLSVSKRGLNRSLAYGSA